MSAGNSVNLIGNLGQDPRMKTTADGMAVASISLALKSFKKDAPTTWINVSAFGKTAEKIEQYCHKGDKLSIEGYLKLNAFTTKDGKEVKQIEVVANSIFPLKSKGGSKEAEPEEKVEANEEIPF